ncbi:MAG: D-alanyl-D-alanine carboxypeptidase/D-alanyl-D-alanine-endopeptidase [Melioribacteraceae bacterium]|nr:D-alanyl-D-alanine carboxypeptidase/D-alanyl-D-alanine-endopeptidase [Melioribacteraceae bacterium]
MFIKHIASSFTLILLSCSVALLAQTRDTTALKKAAAFNSLNELREQLDDSFNDPNFGHAFWGVLIKSLNSGEIIYKRNADKLFNPASNTKLFTSAAALSLLGSDFVYQTNLYANGIIRNNKLAGDLIIQGSGDPTISNRFFNGEVTSIFEAWADSLKSKGITEISGNLFGDDTSFDNFGLGKGWSLDNESSWFSAPSGALSFNDNTLMIKVTPTETNFPADIKVVPNTKYVTVMQKVLTVDNNGEQSINISRLRGSNLISVNGSIKKDSKPVVEYVSISDPTLFFLTVLREVFEQKGITVKGKVGSIAISEKIILAENLSLLFTHESVPLHMIVKELNKNSNNFYAEQILKTIGLEIYNYGSAEYGVKACKDLFGTIGINPDNMIMVDGSGLSRLNLVSPRQIVNLLTFLYSSDEFNPFYNSLPIGGVDGTLANRMKRTSAENNVRAKAGYNENVSSLSGYLKTIGGETLAFSMIINNYLASPNLVDYIEDNVCNRLINFVRN